ncbi:MAG: VOC family protein [Pseudomonadota bacterium]
MTVLSVVEIKAFVPARDFDLSKAFYCDLGFTLASDQEGIAYFHLGSASFLLQDFYQEEHASNFMMHLLVEDVASWYKNLVKNKIADKYSVRLGEPQDQPWGMRDFTLDDPTGVLWRIAQNI